MFSYRPSIDAPPEWKSIEKAAIFGWVGTGVAAISGASFALGLVPHVFISWSTLPVLAMTGILSTISAVKLRAIRRQMQKDFEALGASRQFTFVNGHLPIKYITKIRGVPLLSKTREEERIWFPFPWTNGEAAGHPVDPASVRVPEPIHKRRWTMEWVPYTSSLFKFVGHDGKTYGYFKKSLVLPRGQVWRDRKAWLEKYYPRRMQCVKSWWIEFWIKPELKALLGEHWETKLTDDIKREVAMRHECELLMGVAVACDKSWWEKRIGYGYEYYYIPVLQARLLSLEDDHPQQPVPPPPPLPTFPQATHVFLGKGFKWDTRHTQAYELMKPRDVSEVTEHAPDQGNPIVYGTGLKDETMIFCDMANINQHVGIFGSTGVGKTRYVEPLIVQMIRSGYPVIIIDPKGDADLMNRTYEEARKCGRGHQLRFYSLVLPKNLNVCTYNPLNHYNDPTFLGTRVGAVIPNTKDPFWKEEAIKTSREVLTLCHWMREYLRFIDRDPMTGELPPKYSSRVPKILLMMQLARRRKNASPAEIEAEINEMIRRIDRLDIPSDDKDIETIAKLIQDRRYMPVEWNPTVRQVTAWGIDKTVQFLGWALKIFAFHIYLDNDLQAAPNYPDLAAENDIKNTGMIAGKGIPTMWSAYLQSGNHPLWGLVDPNVLISNQYKRWGDFYRHCLGDLSEESKDMLREILERFRSQIDSVATMAQIERDKFLERISTLSAAMSRFRGARERIVCAQDPDLTWDRAVNENLIVFCGLGQLVDADGANGVAKMMIQDIASYIGEVYNFRDGKERPFVLVCDEIASFINEPMIDLLNKGRGAGLHCIIIGQSMPDLEACLQDKAKAQQVIANLNTKIQLRAGLPVDAEEFSKSAAKVAVEIVVRSGFGITPGIGKSGHEAISGFSANESYRCDVKEVPKIPPEAITGMPRGQAFISMMGETYYVAQGMFPKPQCNMKLEYHMTNDGPDQLDYIPLFEEPPPDWKQSSRVQMSLTDKYLISHTAGSEKGASCKSDDVGTTAPPSAAASSRGGRTAHSASDAQHALSSDNANHSGPSGIGPSSGMGHAGSSSPLQTSASASAIQQTPSAFKATPPKSPTAQWEDQEVAERIDAGGQMPL